MRYRDGRRSLCLSSQSGCPLTCTFCATGSMKFGRNLTASEILDQALHFRRIEAVDHSVFMGMGEPMMNLDNVLAACAAPARRRHHAPAHGDLDGRLGAGHRRGSSTRRPSRSGSRSRCTRPTTRCAREIMPVNERYPLAEVLAACERVLRARRRKVFIEYVMLAGVNDRYEQAVQLATLLDRRDLQGQPDPVQPDRRVRRCLAGGDRRLQGRARPSRDARDRPPDPRPGHRRRLRPARCSRAGRRGRLRRRGRALVRRALRAAPHPERQRRSRARGRRGARGRVARRVRPGAGGTAEVVPTDDAAADPRRLSLRPTARLRRCSSTGTSTSSRPTRSSSGSPIRTRSSSAASGSTAAASSTTRASSTCSRRPRPSCPPPASCRSTSASPATARRRPAATRSSTSSPPTSAARTRR